MLTYIMHNYKHIIHTHIHTYTDTYTHTHIPAYLH